MTDYKEFQEKLAKDGMPFATVYWIWTLLERMARLEEEVSSLTHHVRTGEPIQNNKMHDKDGETRKECAKCEGEGFILIKKDK